MVYEDVFLKSGYTLSQLVNDYGYPSWEWEKIWTDQKNADLVINRKSPEHLLAGDKIIIPINWKIISREMKPIAGSAGHFGINVKRDGQAGKNIKWVQTVFADNQPKFPPSPYTVDLPTDDDEPFYYTTVEMAANPAYRKEFYDAPFRNAPLLRTTNWRAVLSLGIVTEKRVSIFASIVWGVDFGKDGKNSIYKPRDATEYEVNGHINLLNSGVGRTQSFKAGGWTFRRALKF